MVANKQRSDDASVTGRGNSSDVQQRIIQGSIESLQDRRILRGIDRGNSPASLIAASSHGNGSVDQRSIVKSDRIHAQRRHDKAADIGIVAGNSADAPVGKYSGEGNVRSSRRGDSAADLN